jgi:ATP-dependent RNA helicase MSS116
MDQPDLANPAARRRSSSEDIRAIILSPTRELAEQIGAEARKLAKNTGIVVQTAVGGTRKREALFKMWREGCDVLVATPGRLNDLLADPEAKVAAPNLQAFVLDEADRMLDVGFSDEIRQIQDSLPSRTEVERQTLLFSATIPQDVVHLAKSMVRPDNFEFVQTIKADDVPTHERVPQHLVRVEGFENLFPVILEIADKARAAKDAELPFKAIVFFSNTATVEYAYQIFRNTESLSRKSGIQTFEIHSRLNQAQRTRSADYFRRAESAVLFSSDVTARGMDFPNVTDVIQVGLPPDRDQYIHRVGRTGRAGNSGKGWLILAEEEIPEARSRLAGLPIKPNNTIESATHVIGDSEATEAVSRYFSEVENAYTAVPKSSFRSVYLAMLGQKFGRNFQGADLVALLNRWCQKAMGWAEPPAVPPRTVQNRGFSRIPGIRVGHDVDEDERGFRRTDGRQGSGSNFSRGNNNDFRSRDRFGSRSEGGSRSFESRFNSRDGGSRNGGFGGSRDRGSRNGGFGGSRDTRASF